MANSLLQGKVHKMGSLFQTIEKHIPIAESILADNYYLSFEFGEEGAVAYLAGESANFVKIEFGLCDYCRITNVSLKITKYIVDMGLKYNLYKVENSQLHRYLTDRSFGISDLYETDHYRLVANNAILDIIIDKTNDVYITEGGYKYGLVE
ncbi:hypothetical protein [Streptococcus cuniculi]|nr:hypothetical protein [Streptococcus cuniculi]